VLTAAGVARAQEREEQPDATINARGFAEPNVSMLPDALKPQFLQAQPDGRLTFDDRVKLYVRSFTSVETVIGPVFGASIGQWRDQPPQWGQGPGGFSERIASGYARYGISQTIRFALAAADGEDPRFKPSHETGIWRRAKHAIVGNFVVDTSRGDRMPAYSRFAGPYGAAFISNTWYPHGQADTPHAIERGTTAFGCGVAWSLVREFWPDVHRKLHLRM